MREKHFFMAGKVRLILADKFNSLHTFLVVILMQFSPFFILQLTRNLRQHKFAVLPSTSDDKSSDVVSIYLTLIPLNSLTSS